MVSCSARLWIESPGIMFKLQPPEDQKRNRIPSITFHLRLRPDVYPFMSQFLMKQPAYISHNTDASNRWQKAPPISLPRPHSSSATRTSFLIGSDDVTSYPWLANVSGPPSWLLKDSVPQCAVLRWPKQGPRIDKTRYADYQSRRQEVCCIE